MARLQTVARGLRGGVLGRLGGVLGRFWGLLGAERHPFNDVQGVLGPFFWRLLGFLWKRLLVNVFPLMTFGKNTKFTRAKPNDPIHRFDLLVRFVDCSRSSDASIVL